MSRNGASFTAREREMMRRAHHARRLVKHGWLDGWKALDLITAPPAELHERAQHLDMEVRVCRRKRVVS